MKNTLKKIETTETGLNLYFETYGIFIPYAVDKPDWDKAKEMASERGHTLPTVEQGLSVIEYVDKIDKELEKAGEPVFDDFFWLDREHAEDSRYAWYVYMFNGNVDCNIKGNTFNVRAVSAFQI